MDYMKQVLDARVAANSLKLNTTEEKNNALKAISDALINNIDSIIEANKIDLANATDIPQVMVKRLELNESKITFSALLLSSLIFIFGKSLFIFSKYILSILDNDLGTSWSSNFASLMTSPKFIPENPALSSILLVFIFT